MLLSPVGYAHMTSLLCTLAGGRVVVALEGGYDLRSTSRAAAACMRVLLGEPPPRMPPREPRRSALSDIAATLRAIAPYWPGVSAPAEPPVAPPSRPQAGTRREREAAARRAIKKARARAFRGRWWGRFI